MIYVTKYGDIYVLNIGFIYDCSVWAGSRFEISVAAAARAVRAYISGRRFLVRQRGRYLRRKKIPDSAPA